VPRLPVSAGAITARLARLAGIRACPECAIPAAQAITDITHLVHGLHADLLEARLDAANLRAAIYAALGAAGDGDPDPLGYLKDELPAREQLPGCDRGWCS
jgi:hypothetical protein